MLLRDQETILIFNYKVIYSHFFIIFFQFFSFHKFTINIVYIYANSIRLRHRGLSIRKVSTEENDGGMSRKLFLPGIGTWYRARTTRGYNVFLSAVPPRGTVNFKPDAEIRASR